MFTGIIEGIGEVLKVRRTSEIIELTLSLPFVPEKGESISVDGVCLTVKDFSSNIAKFDGVSETLKRTTIGFLSEGKMVNLERALRPQGRLDGHIVLGHVDSIGKIIDFKKRKGENIIYISFPVGLKELVSCKGSITIDGISLTVVDISKDFFTISIIPFTLKNTTMQFKKVGDYVNIEVDVIARYLKRMMEVRDGRI